MKNVLLILALVSCQGVLAATATEKIEPETEIELEPMASDEKAPAPADNAPKTAELDESEDDASAFRRWTFNGDPR